MSLKKLYYDKNIKCCLTCIFIDEYTLAVNKGNGEVPQGYDGTACCDKYEPKEKESSDNRFFTSPVWKACSKYQKCTERQSLYLDIYDRKTNSIIPNPNDISKIK